MHSHEQSFNEGVRRVADELAAILTERMRQVELDAQDFCRQPDVSSTLAQVTMIEATGTVDALNWARARLDDLRAVYSAS